MSVKIKGHNCSFSRGYKRGPFVPCCLGWDSQQAQDSGQAGSILIMTLLLITILVVTITESMRRMQVEQVSASLYAKTLKGQALCRSATAVITYLLAQDAGEQKQSFDHYGEAWARFPRQEDIDLSQFPYQDINATIVDEKGKFPINSLVTPDGQWSESHQRVFECLLQNPPFSLDPGEVAELLPPIKDWIDADNQQSGVYGAEKDDYLMEDRPFCRNAPFEFNRELLLVKGMTGKLYTGTKEHPGLGSLISVHTRGSININTAGKEILAAMVNPGISQETAQDFAKDMIQYRQNKMHFHVLDKPDWYRNEMAGYNDVQLPPALVSTQSHIFSLLVQAVSGSVRSSTFTILKRNHMDGEVIVQRLLIQRQ